MPTKTEMQALGDEIIRSYEDRINAGRRREVAAQLKKDREDRSAMSQVLRSTLSKAGAQRKRDVKSQLREYDEAHGSMSLELRSTLSQEEAERHREEAERHRVTAAEISRRKAEISHHKRTVTAQLREYGQTHSAMGQRLRADLAETEAQRNREVTGLLAEYREEQDGARQVWCDLAETMRSKRSGAVGIMEPPPSPVVEETPPPPAVEGPVQVEEEEAVESAVVGEVTPEFVSLIERLFDHLANHPDGSRLIELEEEFGLNRFEAARAIRRLMDDGKVEKEELRYYAI